MTGQVVNLASSFTINSNGIDNDQTTMDRSAPVGRSFVGARDRIVIQVQDKPQVLLVDDEPEILIALEDLLSDQFVVKTAQSGKDALRLMGESEDIAVVVTDQRMPQMQGDELVAHIQGLHTAQRILVTGYADLGAVVRAVNEGQIFAYVTKPWNEADLRMKVSKAAEQFRLSRELAAEKQLLDDLMNNSPDGIFFKDQELKFIRANKTLARWLGTDVDSLVGKKLTDVMSSLDDAQRFEAEERQSLLDNRAILDSVRQEATGRGLRWFSETKAPVHGLDDSGVRLVGISRDVSQQRELEQQLLQSQKMEAMGKLAGGVAHDFNNLLMVIQAYGELLRDGVSHEATRLDHAEQLLKAVDRAAALTKQLLTFSRKGPARITQVNVNEVVVEVVKMLSRLVPENIELRTMLMVNQELVRADATNLEQVLINLVINARDAMPQGGQIVIRTELSVPGTDETGASSRFVRLSVEDNGMGMSREIRERIFEPFFTTKDVGKGTGLGLSTAYGIICQLGGDISVESEQGQGTRFTIDIPCAPPKTRSSPAKHFSKHPSPGSETILLVEDDDDVKRVTDRILTNNGYTVLSAGHPDEAQRLCAEHTGTIDLLLTDVSMPQMDGVTLAGHLMQLRPQLRVLYMSGYVAEDSNLEKLGEQACNYLEKPFGPDGLLEAIRQVLSTE